MSALEHSELRSRIGVLERRMRPLEWDLKANQINAARKAQLEVLREEHRSLTEQLSTEKNEEN